jgi:DNA-binding MarR family transcriptional regulator
MDLHETAREVVRIIPLVMRVVGAEIRRNPNFQDPSQVGILRMLSHKGSCSMGDMADRMSVSLPTMSKTMRRMEMRQWVTLRRDHEDRRTVWAEVTSDGRAAVDEVYEQTANHVEGLLRTLSSDEQQTLADGLAVMRDLFEKAIRNDSPVLTSK